MAEMSRQKGKKLTLYIFIALAIGISLGFILNGSYIKSENDQLVTISSSLESLKKQQAAITDTTSDSYKSIVAIKADLAARKKTVTEVRDKKLEPFSLIADIFLRLIKMIVAPLVFTTLVVGVAKLGDIKSVGRIGGKTLLWFFSASFASLLLGLMLVNFFEPGTRMNLPLPESADTGIKATALSLREFLYHVFPTSVIDAMAKNEILQIVVFAIFFGVGTAAIGEKGE